MSSKDSALRRELAKYGVDPGPITDTTRNIYVRRLEKLRKENAEVGLCLDFTYPGSSCVYWSV